MDYCTSQLPPTFSEEVEIDQYWHEVGLLKDISGDIQYPLLSKLAKAVLTIPHGNADIERMFSHLGLNKTKLFGYRNTYGSTQAAVQCKRTMLQFQTHKTDD
jgi:hypothetical protein